MSQIVKRAATIYSDSTITLSWSWPTIGQYQRIQINYAEWHWTASRYAVPYKDVYHNQMFATNGGNGHNKEGITTESLGITTSTTSATAYFDLFNTNAGSADVWLVIDYTIINVIPPSTPTAGNVTAGQVSTVTIANTAGLGSIWHRTIWKIGSYSDYSDTGLNVNQATKTIPGTWQQAFSGSTGTLEITLITYLTSNEEVGRKTINVTLTRDPNYDVPVSTISVSNVTAGQASAVSFTNSMLSNTKHSVTWTIGTHTHTENTLTGAASASYTIPTSWCEEFPSANSGQMTVSVTTYNTYDEAMGNPVVRTVTLSVPAYTPSVAGVAAGINLEWGLYLQSRSRVTITITAAGMYGSTITSYAIAGHNLNVQAQSGTSEILTSTGQQTYTCTVIDTRGKVGTATVQITVVAYSPPMITQADAYRCDELTYDPDTKGNRCAYLFDYNYADCNGNNTLTASIVLKQGNNTITTISNPTKGQADLLYALLNTVLSYTATFTITDSLGNSDTFEDMIPTAAVYMYFSQQLNSIGIGVYPEHPNSVELGNGFHLYLNGVEITTS